MLRPETVRGVLSKGNSGSCKQSSSNYNASGELERLSIAEEDHSTAILPPGLWPSATECPFILLRLRHQAPCETQAGESSSFDDEGDTPQPLELMRGRTAFAARTPATAAPAVPTRARHAANTRSGSDSGGGPPPLQSCSDSSSDDSDGDAPQSLQSPLPYLSSSLPAAPALRRQKRQQHQSFHGTHTPRAAASPSKIERALLTTTASKPLVCRRGPLKLEVEFRKMAEYAGASQEATVQAAKAAVKA
jgi:hypothetical protein